MVFKKIMEIDFINSIRPLSKLAAEDEAREEAARRTGVCTQVHEDSSTDSTKQFTAAVAFRKRSIDRFSVYRTLPPLLLSLLAVILWFTTNHHTLEYNRFAIAQGQWWRFITGHWVHHNFPHFFWDTVDFLVFGLIVCYRSPIMFWVLMALSMTCISLYSWLHQSPLIFLGLSGINHAFFAYITIDFALLFWSRRHYTWSVGAILLLIISVPTVLWQTYFNHSFFYFLGLQSNVFVAAHLIALACGVSCCILLRPIHLYLLKIMYSKTTKTRYKDVMLCKKLQQTTTK